MHDLPVFFHINFLPLQIYINRYVKELTLLHCARYLDCEQKYVAIKGPWLGLICHNSLPIPKFRRLNVEVFKQISKFTLYIPVPVIFMYAEFYVNQCSLQWRHNGRDGVSNHQPHDCFLNRLFRRRSKETSKLHVIGLCAGNSPGTGEFPAQMTSNAENVSILDVIMGYTILPARVKCRKKGRRRCPSDLKPVFAEQRN